MTTQALVALIKRRSHHSDDVLVQNELNSAKDWAYERLYNSEVGPDLLITYGTEITLAARTRDYNLGADAAISGTLYGIKQLWLKFSTDVAFTPMRAADSTDLRYIFNDQWASTDTTTVATGHPVLYDVVNFNKVRFSPPLPAGALVRVDYFRRPPDLDATTNDALAFGDDIPLPVHDAIADKATAQVFHLMDDSRWSEWEAKAEARLNSAMYNVQRRTQSPTETRPYAVRRRRYI
jgi:hypothetical protein